MDDDKKRVDLNWQDKYYTPNEIYDNCGTLINVDKAIVECNALLQEVNLHFEYEPKLEIIEEYQSNHETLKLYIQELQAYIAEKIDTPLYKDFNKNATESISRIHMEDYEVDNTIGGVTIKDYSYQTTVKEEEKEKLTFYDFIGVNDGDINYWTGEYQEGKVEAFASIFSEQYKAYQEMGLTEGFDSEKDFMEAFFEQGEFDHKVDKPFLNFVSSVLDATIVIPIFEAAMGEDFITGEDLTDFERGMKLVFAFVDIFTFGQGKLAGESLGKLFVLNFVSNAASSATASICNELELPAPLTFLLSMGSGITVSTCGTKLIIKGSTVTKELDLSEKQMQKLGGLFEGTDDIKIKNIDVIDGVDMNGLKNTGDGIDINAMKKASDSIDVNGVKKAIDSSLETSYGESSGSSAYQSGTDSIGNIGNPSDNPKVLADAMEDSAAVYGYRPREDGSIEQFANYDWSDPKVVAELREIRLDYLQENRSYQNMVDNMRNAGCSDTEIAQRLVAERNAHRLSYYVDETGKIINEDLYRQAVEHCVSYEDLRKGINGKSPKTDLQIIESAMKSNPGYDACCGLYGH